MPIETTYSKARAEFAKLWDSLIEDRDIAIVQRRGAEPIAMLAASELEGLLETSHLLRSPRNAERLLTALSRALRNEVSPITTDAVNELRAEIGLDDAEA